ncbi:MAG: hypothetical protein LJE95_09065 [Acidobacteria bacterium]|nr:hypothetical protein [Acidobacteriota bacterium]
MSREVSTPDADQAPDRSRFGELHTRTYEMELLVSGAVVFGLLQLPGVLGPAFERFHASLSGGLRLLGGAAQSYVTMVLWVLIATFVLHLVLRAYWIGLLGLESVFKQGVRSERVKLQTGPLTFQTYQRKLGSLAQVIDRTDDRCSLLFSFGFLIVGIFVYSVLVVTAAVAVAVGLSHLVLGGRHISTLFWLALAVFVMLQPTANFLDKRLGPRVRPGGVPARLLGWLVSVAFVTSPMRWMGITVLTLSSNLSPARVSAAVITVCCLLGAGHVAGVFAQRGLVHVGSLSYFPLGLREQGIDPDHYRDRRAEGMGRSGSPSVQSVLVAEPYLELMVPYVPRRHNNLVRSACPELPLLRHEGLTIGRGIADSKAGAAAACIGSLFTVQLDGEVLAEPHWDFTVEPGNRLPAVVSFVPMSGLPRGRHELEVLVPGRHAKVGDPDLERHVIPFWR